MEDACRTEGVNTAIPEVGDQNVATECSKVGGGDGQSPGSVKRPLTGKTILEIPIQIKQIPKAASRTNHSIRLAGVLFTVCNDKPGSALNDIEGSIARRQIGIREGTGENGRLKILVEDIDGSGKKISSVEEIASSVVAELQALVVGVG